MTFTRKAAGEFFERILQELARRCETAPGDPEPLRLLRKVVRRMDQLRLGTIDSFFATMAQCLPFELGLTGKSALMSDDEAVRAQEEVLDSLLLVIGRMENRGSLDELREVWKEASQGSEHGRPAEALGKWCGRLHQVVIECQEAIRWGHSEAIWPDGEDPSAVAGEDMGTAVDELEECVDFSKFDKRAVKSWEGFYKEARLFDGYQKLGKTRIEYMLDEARGDFSKLRLGGVEWMMYKRTVLDRATGTALARVLEIILARVLRVHLRRTRARHGIMRLYETTYHRMVRSRGRLLFSDLAWLLCGRLSTTLRPRDSWDTLRNALEYRMDARYDHWLLDEFQDTSERQWEVLSPLLEEARQDPEEKRSVFLVGDLKQSIYLWRQAEPELFQHVEHQWAGDRLLITPLNESYRSCPEVLAMVNAVFDGANDTLEALFPGIGTLWQYETHHCSAKVAKLAGHAALVKIDAEDDEAEKNHAVTLAAAEIIRKVNPLERGLTCAVLVTRNEYARELAESLRALLKMEVICESRENVAVDNPVTTALLSLIQLAAHPGDTFAWQHVAMTPLSHYCAAQDLGPGAVSAQVRRDLSALGFLGVLEKWSARFRECLGEVDSFTDRRLAQLLDFAATFDESGSRDADDFLRRAREHAVREDGASARAVQVMTVHQSKGLQFDVVILPETQGKGMDDVTRNRLFVSRAQRGQIQWILDKPDKIVVSRTPVLEAEDRREKARQAFEALCRFYVAMTRAKLGLYVLVAEKARASKRNEAHLLETRLGGQGSEPAAFPFVEAAVCLWEAGTADWFLKYASCTGPGPVAETVDATVDLSALIREVNRPLERRAPSGEESFLLRGSDLVSPGREAKRQFGLRVHELLSAVAWLDETPNVEAVWLGKGLLSPKADEAEGFDGAVVEVQRLLASPEVRPWFTRSGAKREVWMEHRFDFVADGGWISGIIDRVVIEKDLLGEVVSATILDFKTDAVLSEADMAAKVEGYAPQIRLYVPAVAGLTGLPESQIKTALIFTANGSVRSV
jgi:ATP-dependent exoDNAse (exonuclease V) beta subunit